MHKSKKVSVVTDIANQYALQDMSFAIVNYTGMSASSDVELRSALRLIPGGGIRVIKNTLHKRALSASKFSDMAAMLVGQVALVWSSDMIEMAKVLLKYDTELEYIKIVCSSDGIGLYDRNQVIVFAKTPPLSVLRARLLMMLNAPAVSVVAILNAIPTKLARVLSMRPKIH